MLLHDPRGVDPTERFLEAFAGVLLASAGDFTGLPKLGQTGSTDPMLVTPQELVDVTLSHPHHHPLRGDVASILRQLRAPLWSS